MAFTSETARKAGQHPKKRQDIVTQALILALNEIDPETGRKKARVLAEKLVAKAIDGDVAAAREVLDRVEGKSVQINENHNFTHRASELSDDELAGYLAGASSVGAIETQEDTPKPH